MKLSPEERKEKKKEVNRQYQLKNKEVLKEKRKEYLKKRLQNMTEEQREERKEYNKRYRQNMTEEQKNKTITTPLKRKPPNIPPSQKSPQYRKIPTSL
jgi:hypothetical protein